MIQPEALSVADAATMIGIGRVKLYQIINSGELPTVKIGDRRLIRVEALRSWLAAKEKRAA